VSARVRVSIVGAAGYTGGELLRLLLGHPEVEIVQATSESHAGEPATRCHPNLRKRTALAFCRPADLQPCDLLFLCLPHGHAMHQIDRLSALAPRLIDLSADFRLKSPGAYRTWYGQDHPRPDLLDQFIYGIPELHREAMKSARYISSAGCNATAVILALHPLAAGGMIHTDRTVVEVKVGSSEGGSQPSDSSHHPERSNCVRSYKATGHRHIGEMTQELGRREPFFLHFSATAIDLVRGILATCHVFPKKPLADKDIWKVYRQAYGEEPFVRIVKDREGIHRLPEPKLLFGTNYCDIGFENDPAGNRLVVFSAIDNLMKGAAGQALQAFNLMHGFPETTGLEFTGLHPV
jgi:N-acetyl-gamma-glutamyl-phosphate/LysW-gamma-L-alpha-aminoadipyl-6-phosphate reductase